MPAQYLREFESFNYTPNFAPYLSTMERNRIKFCHNVDVCANEIWTRRAKCEFARKIYGDGIRSGHKEGLCLGETGDDIDLVPHTQDD